MCTKTQNEVILSRHKHFRRKKRKKTEILGQFIAIHWHQWSIHILLSFLFNLLGIAVKAQTARGEITFFFGWQKYWNRRACFKQRSRHDFNSDFNSVAMVEQQKNFPGQNEFGFCFCPPWKTEQISPAKRVTTVGQQHWGRSMLSLGLNTFFSRKFMTLINVATKYSLGPSLRCQELNYIK